MAIIIDALKLQNEHPERLQIAWDAIKDDGLYDCKSLTLVKDLGDAYVFKMEVEKEEVEPDPSVVIRNGFGGSEAIVVDSEKKCYYTKVFSFSNYYFTSEEISKWRYEYYNELRAIGKKYDGDPSDEECLNMIVGFTDNLAVQVMPYNTPRRYAEMMCDISIP